VDIIVSEYTKGAVPDYEYRFIDKVRVKGKDQPVTIYEPLGPKNEISLEIETELEMHKNALGSFLAQDWSSANDMFLELTQNYPDRKLYSLYLERTEVYQATPPEVNWDGVFTHTSK